MSPGVGERNYHVGYMLCKARRLADRLKLPSAAELRYTGLTGCLESPGWDDAEELLLCEEAMVHVGVNAEAQAWLWRPNHNPNPITNTNPYPNANPSPNPNPNPNPNPDPNPNPNPNPNPDSNPNPNPNPDSNLNPNSNPDSNPNPSTNTNATPIAEAQEWLWRVVGALLMLGQLEFGEAEGSTEAKLVEPELLETLCGLLKVVACSRGSMVAVAVAVA